MIQMLKALTVALSSFVLAGTLLPLWRTEKWWVRVFDFTHLQIIFIGLLLIPALCLLLPQLPVVFGKVLLATVAFATAANFWWIFPYTRLAGKQVLAAEASDRSLAILAANVLQENRNSARLLEEIRRVRPDVILILEADKRWTGELSSLTNEFPHTILHPRTNTYGMNLYSRFPLVNPEVRFLTDHNVPSIRTRLEFHDTHVLFYGVHPRPPARPAEGDVQPLDSTQRDAELVLVAREIEGMEEPVIVAGDFNDVAWSHTSRMFQRISRLLDPRIGRGFFNTYHARFPLLRFPLDHLLHSDDFTLVDMQRLGKIGSDHFPIFAVLQLERGAVPQQEAPPQKPSDEKEASEAVRKNQHEE